MQTCREKSGKHGACVWRVDNSHYFLRAQLQAKKDGMEEAKSQRHQ